MEDNITVLVDAKIEYTKQLTNIIIPFIFEGIKSIYQSTLTMCKLNEDRNVLMRFQEQLSQIPKWNQDIIDDEFNRIMEDSNCDWLDELVTAVFLSHTKILTAIKSGKKQNKINLKIPKIEHFIHKCYIESAREIWKNPYIYNSNVSQCDYQRNINDAHKLIGSAIEETIRKLLPVKNILKEYLGKGYESDEEKSLLPESYKKNLRKLVQKEIEIYKQNDNKPNEDDIVEKMEEIHLGKNLSKKIENDELDLDIDLEELKNENNKEENKVENEVNNKVENEVENEVNNKVENEVEANNLVENTLKIESLNENIEGITDIEDFTDNELEENKLEVNDVNDLKINDINELDTNNIKLNELDISDNLNELKLDILPLNNSEQKLNDVEELELNEIKLENSNNTIEEPKLNKIHESILNDSEEPELNELNLDILKEVKPIEESIVSQVEETNVVKEVKVVEVKPVEVKPVEEVNVEEVNVEEANVEEVKVVEVKPLEENILLEEIKVEAEEVKPLENAKVEPEVKVVEEVKVEEMKLEEIEPKVHVDDNLEEIKLEVSNPNSNDNDIKDIKNIISNNLYDQNINEESDKSLADDVYTTDEEGENIDAFELENMTFKKNDLGNLEIDRLSDMESDFETDEYNKSNEVYKSIQNNDLELRNNNDTTSNNLNKNKSDVKTIIIENENKSKNPMRKMNKSKKKSFKFFD